MSNFNNISIDDIETNVMSILYANIDKVFTQYTLFNVLIQYKYDFKDTNFIHSDFKSKFLLVIKNLMSKYDDIKITRENMTYNIVCLSNSNIKFDELNKILDNNKSTTSNIKLDENDISIMYDYIFDNGLTEYINLSDPFDGNSIYHELVLSNNIKQINKLIEDGLFNYTIINNHNQTPIDLIKSPQMAKIITQQLIKKLNSNEEILKRKEIVLDVFARNNNDMKIYYESDEYKNKIIFDTYLYDFITVKINKYNFPIMMYLFSFIMCCVVIRFF